MREAYRLQKIDLQNAIETSGKNLAVFFLYTAKELPEFDLIKNKMQLVLQRLEKIMKPSDDLRRPKTNDLMT